MNVIPFVHEGLGNSSYLVELGGGEALLVDPDRTVDRYLAAARGRGLRIAGVLETHLHADFISGAHELGYRVQARVLLPAEAHARFPHHALAAGEPVELAGVRVESIGSPGHTPEHLAYVVRPAAGPPLLFSGGSLIVGGAARTDLIAPEQTDALTRAQHRTIRHAFAALPDETLLYPTHGAGSFCSVGTGGERASTLGQERATNSLLALADEDEFARTFPSTFPAAPDYFFRLRPVNQAGPRLRHEIVEPPALSPRDFEAASRDALVVDLRPVADYMGGHIPGALSDAFRDSYATWLGWLFPLDTPLLFVTGDVPLQSVIDESLLVGFERLVGWLEGGMPAWQAAGRPVLHSPFLGAHEAKHLLADGAAAVDVREPAEFHEGRIPAARHLPLGRLPQRVDELPRDRPLVVYCGHGERAATAVSLLERAGFDSLANLDGGMEAWNSAGLRREQGDL